MSKMTDIQMKLRDLLPEIALINNEPMAKHTSFRIGGAVEVMAFPKTPEELSQIMKAADQLGVKTAVLGAGTNILAPDAGIPGLVVCLKDCLGGMERLDDTHIRVMAGVTMTRAALYAASLGLTGLEFSHGIPGSVGGGVYMNAGAYGGEICQVCCGATVMNRRGEMRHLTGEEMEFSYRHSVLEDSGELVVSADFALTPGNEEQIRSRMKELMAKRSASQPLDKPSAGSTFKRPVGGYAAALIDGAGLKGYRVGDAAVSEKHAGFVVNLGQATAEDVKKLMAQVSEIVNEKSGIRLEPEVRIW